MPFHVFLSHSSADKPVVEELARRLAKEGIQAWLDKWHLIPGNPWQPDIEKALGESETCAVFVGPSGFGPWQNEEMRAAIDQRVRDSGRRFRVIPVLLPGAERGERSSLPTFLAATTWVEFRDSLEDPAAFHRLVCGIRGLEPGAGPGQAIYEGQCPYRGLRVFDVDDAPFFFGREALVQWLLNELRPAVEGQQVNRFLAIVGSSGSGKSSLARAGLVAALKHDAIPGSAWWPIAICRPGPDPLESLAVALSRAANVGQGAPALAELIAEFQENEKTLHLIARQSLPENAPDTRLVVVVDQFEEVFTLCPKEKFRDALVRNLLYASKVAQGQTLVILTMRADFYGKCAANAELAAAFSDHHVLVGLMTDDELRRAIERPTQLVGCELEAGLVDLLVQDVRRQPGALPLLQHALLELWNKREGRRLTVKAYQEIGKLEGALQRRADATLKAFSQDEQELCRRTFLRLTQPGEGTEDTKRRASMQELLSLSGKLRDEEDIIQKLADASLLTTEGDLTHRDAFVEVAHEALIRNWPQLRKWIDADRAGLRTRTRLSESARDWKNSGRDPAYLYTGARIAVAEEWAASHPSELSIDEAEFLRCSRETQQQRQADEMRAVQERARAERERALRKRERWYTGGLILLGTFSLLGFGWKYYDLAAAKKRSVESSQKYLHHAQDISQSADPIKDVKELWNLSLALQYDIRNAEAARRACELLYGKNWCVPMTSNLHHKYLSTATLGPKGSRTKIFAVSEDGELLVLRDGKPALSKDKVLFTADNEKRASTPAGAFFSDDGKWLLVIPPGSTPVASANPPLAGYEPVRAEIWHWSSELDSYERVQQEVKMNGGNPFRTVVWNSDSTTFAVVSYSSGFTRSFCQVFKREGYSYVPISDVSDRFTTSKVVALCFDIHNQWLATASYDGSGGKVELWDPVTFAHTEIATGAKPPYPLDGRPASIGSGPAENELTITIAIAGQPSQVLDLTTGKFRQSFSPPTPRDQNMRIIFGPEHSGRRQEGIVLYRRMVFADSANTPRSEPICFQGTVANAEFSDDGKSIMTLSGDNLNAIDTIRIWSGPLPDPPPDADNHQFTGKNAPFWLADLAELVTGAKLVSSLETSDEETTSLSRHQITESAPKEVQGEYKKIWQRFEPILEEDW